MPRKNLRRVGGVPLVARAIAAARATASIDRVVVSTDDQEIAAVAQEWGAQVDRATRRRSPATRRPARAPCCTPSMLSRTRESRRASSSSSRRPRRSSTPGTSTSPSTWSGRTSTTASSPRPRPTGSCGPRRPAARRGVNHDPSVRPRRQDREPHYLETGAFYVMDAAGFRAAGHRFFGRVGLVEVAERTAIEIDSEEQLAMARAIAPLDAPGRRRRWTSTPW